MSQIPLYNCYWCKCAWCVKAWKCDLRDCYICKQMDKKGKLPLLKKDCRSYVAESDYTYKLVRAIQACDNCKYKKLVILLKWELENKNL